MNQQKASFLTPEVLARQLLWRRGDPDRQLQGILDSLPVRSVQSPTTIESEASRSSAARLFDFVLGADCLFFKDFHDDLLWVIRTALSPTGTAVFLQPRRGGTVELFIKKAQPWFTTELIEDYDDLVIGTLWVPVPPLPPPLSIQG